MLYIKAKMALIFKSDPNRSPQYTKRKIYGIYALELSSREVTQMISFGDGTKKHYKYNNNKRFRWKQDNIYMIIFTNS